MNLGGNEVVSRIIYTILIYSTNATNWKSAPHDPIYTIRNGATTCVHFQNDHSPVRITSTHHHIRWLPARYRNGHTTNPERQIFAHNKATTALSPISARPPVDRYSSSQSCSSHVGRIRCERKIVYLQPWHVLVYTCVIVCSKRACLHFDSYMFCRLHAFAIVALRDSDADEVGLLSLFAPSSHQHTQTHTTSSTYATIDVCFFSVQLCMRVLEPSRHTNSHTQLLLTSSHSASETYTTHYDMVCVLYFRSMAASHCC